LAHVFWRIALGMCLGIDAAHVPLKSTPGGQPQLTGTSFATSLSHSNHWIAMAVCQAATIGVDIECSPTNMALNELMKTFFAPNEAIEMEKLSRPMREPALVQLWTRKEALLKAFGVGLMTGPTSVSAMTDHVIAPPPSAAEIPACRIHDLFLPPGLVGAMANPDTVHSYRLHTLNNT
jgi:4'-phosphopantetheinyl transferase